MQPVHILTQYFFKINEAVYFHLHQDFASGLFPSGFPAKTPFSYYPQVLA
jgi:hypothetical protein